MNNNNSFAYYKLPNERCYHYIGSDSAPLRLPQLSAITERHSGFLIVPFDADDYPILLITPEAEERHEMPLPASIVTFNQEAEKAVDNRYLRHFEECKRQLEAGALQKVVLAHQFVEEGIAIASPGELFLLAATVFPKCYVALWHTPETGSWLTITPEVLLESTEGEAWHTVALAGTMQREETLWSEKNRREQQYVADYITSVLTPHVSDFTHSEVQTIEAAQLKHLRTDFYFKPQAKIGELLEALHPTPAVCGLPKVEAYTAIKQIESTPRRYYAGCSGPLQSLTEGTHLYVTLRCAHWRENSAIAYFAGGGLLKESNLQEEWQEINTKKQTAKCIVTKHISTI
ncbi:MAG: chorismate-binding protein [Bacteroidaceae bacterium]|nr:chorismate-binding protein [Bacteroidaceae bacterium]